MVWRWWQVAGGRHAETTPVVGDRRLLPFSLHASPSTPSYYFTLSFIHFHFTISSSYLFISFICLTIIIPLFPSSSLDIPFIEGSRDTYHHQSSSPIDYLPLIIYYLLITLPLIIYFHLLLITTITDYADHDY